MTDPQRTPREQALLDRAIVAHDENCSCDRKYRMSCHVMAAAILKQASIQNAEALKRLDD